LFALLVRSFALFVRSFRRSCVPPFLPSFLPSFRPSFLPSFLHSFLHSFIPSSIPSFVTHRLVDFLPSVVVANCRSPFAIVVAAVAAAVLPWSFVVVSLRGHQGCLGQ